MPNEFVFIADFFANQIAGGGELNNEEAIDLLKKRGHAVIKINSHLVTPDYIAKNLNKKFIVGNFINLSEKCRSALIDQTEYVIYEHDHKYLQTRDPSIFPEFLAPESAIVNRQFYKNATIVLGQSKSHTEIIRKNLGYENIVNLGGNLWSEDVLNFIEELASTEKRKKASIMQSSNPIKNTSDAITYCKIKNIDYELIPPQKYEDFLTSLSKNDTLIFFPKTAETLSRIIVEARMMGITTITNKLIGALSEDWFKTKGTKLIETMRNKRVTIIDIIERAFTECDSDQLGENK